MSHRICYVGTEITPSEGSTFVGGHVNTVVRLCKGLSNLGWEIHLITTPSRFLKEEKFSFPWAKIHLIRTKARHNSPKYALEFFLKAIRMIESLSRNKPFDLIHAHSGYFSPAAIPIVAKRRLGTPALFSLYCPASLLPSRLPMDKYVIRILSARLDKVIAVTDNVKRSLVKCGVPGDKIIVIPSSIDESVFNPFVRGRKTSREPGEMTSNTPGVLFVGNIERAKGLDVFLDAAQYILQRSPGTKFVITLHEPYETVKSFRVLASHKLGSSVDVIGLVKDMPSLIADADVVVVPFRSTEGISDVPLIVLEAMAMGKPVVASRLEGIGEVIQDRQNGYLVEPDRADELANAILAVLDDQNLRKRISERAILSVRRFSNMEVSRRLSELYESIGRSHNEH
jgi:glycosyltransferase involved in cell wall biosynthesis